MSNTSMKFVFALFVAFAPVAGLFAAHAGTGARRTVPTPTIRPGQAGKCFQVNPATAAERERAEFVHPDGVCRAPQTIIDDAGV
jgi:hypothetical protein